MKTVSFCDTKSVDINADPVDRHQLTVPTMLLSKKGEDFQSGGLVVERAGGERVDVDASTAALIGNGRVLPRFESATGAGPWAVFGPSGQLLAVYEAFRAEQADAPAQPELTGMAVPEPNCHQKLPFFT